MGGAGSLPGKAGVVLMFANVLYMKSRGMKAVQFSGRCNPLINGSKSRYKTETPIFYIHCCMLVRI